MQANTPLRKESTGYPTQKPLALYERIISASSKQGDIVLDPFCGCATTNVAAERLGRQWVGIDIWEGAYEMVIDRLAKEGLAVPEPTDNPDRLMTFGDVHYVTVPPLRTDDDEVAAPVLKLRTQRAKKPWQKLTNRTVRALLRNAQAASDGLVWCAGCGRALEIEFMHLDHIQPRSDGGENWITNRVLLCAPCNGRKSDKLTMRGLRNKNKKAGWLKDDNRASNAQVLAKTAAITIRDDWDTLDAKLLLNQANLDLSFG